MSQVATVTLICIYIRIRIDRTIEYNIIIGVISYIND